MSHLTENNEITCLFLRLSVMVAYGRGAKQKACISVLKERDWREDLKEKGKNNKACLSVNVKGLFET